MNAINRVDLIATANWISEADRSANDVGAMSLWITVCDLTWNFKVQRDCRIERLVGWTGWWLNFLELKKIHQLLVLRWHRRVHSAIIMVACKQARLTKAEKLIEKKSELNVRLYAIRLRHVTGKVWRLSTGEMPRKLLARQLASEGCLRGWLEMPKRVPGKQESLGMRSYPAADWAWSTPTKRQWGRCKLVKFMKSNSKMFSEFHFEDSNDLQNPSKHCFNLPVVISLFSAVLASSLLESARLW